MINNFLIFDNTSRRTARKICQIIDFSAVHEQIITFRKVLLSYFFEQKTFVGLIVISDFFTVGTIFPSNNKALSKTVLISPA